MSRAVVLLTALVLAGAPLGSALATEEAPDEYGDPGIDSTEPAAEAEAHPAPQAREAFPAIAAAEAEAAREPVAEAAAEGAAHVRGQGPNTIHYTNLTALRYNPLGLQNQFEVNFRRQLFDPGDSPILENNYIALVIAPIFSPATARLGVALDVRPLNILKLEVRYEALFYFGNFNLLPAFAHANEDFSDSAIKDRGEAGLNYATQGSQVTLDAEVRAPLGPFVVRSRFKASYVDVALRGEDTVWYEQYFDILLPKSGWFFMNDADLLLPLGNLTVGIRHHFSTTSYPDEAFLEGESRTTSSVPNHRLGPIVAYRFSDNPGATWNQPTVILLVNWYLKHRWRTGADVSQAIPYVVLGFAFNGDFL